MRRKILLVAVAAAAAASVAGTSHHVPGGPARSGSLLIAGIVRAL